MGGFGTVNAINNPGVNQIGGFSAQINTTDGSSHIWGHLTGGSGAGFTPLLKGGDLIGGLGGLSQVTSGMDFDYRVSMLGSHYIIEAQVNSGSTTNDGVMVFDGSAVMAGGSPMREGTLVPAGVGGIGDNWANFDFQGISESGKHLVTGDTSAGVPSLRRLPWAHLLARVFLVDALCCARCGSRMRILAAIQTPDAIRSILECLGLPARPPPLMPAVPSDLSYADA
jgi:hypothetical protein